MVTQETNRVDVGKFLRTRREELGLTQEEVALRADVSPSLIAKLEQGRQDLSRMKVGNLIRLAEVLKITPDELRKLLGEPTFPLVNLIPAKVKMVPVLGEAMAGKTIEYGIPVEYYRPGSVVFFVSGDSMDDGTEKAILDGDMVLVDTSLTDLRPGGLYVLEIIGDGYTVKEARKLNGEWAFFSWNPNYGILRPDEVRVVGEVYAVNRIRRVRR